MSQIDKLYDSLYDVIPKRSDQLLKEVYGSEHLGIARLAARVSDLKKKHGLMIRGWRDSEKPSLYWYQIIKLNFNGQPINQNEQKVSHKLQN